MLPAGGKLDGCGAAKSGRIVVLGARRHVDDDGFGVAADVNPILFALPCSGEAIERSANRDGHGAGAADASAGGSFGIGYQREAALRAEELGDFRKERKAIALGLHERGEGGEGFFALRVARRQTNGFAAVGFNTAGSVERNCSVDGDGTGMEKIERPDVKCAAGKVYTRWRLRFDDHRCSQS